MKRWMYIQIVKDIQINNPRAVHTDGQTGGQIKDDNDTLPSKSF